MRVYTIKSVMGFWLTQIGLEMPYWYTGLPAIGTPRLPGIRGIEPELQWAYEKYLARVGQYTFGVVPGPVQTGGFFVDELEEFVTVMANKLWPSYGRLWLPVGAEKGRFDSESVMRLYEPVGLRMVRRKMVEGDLFLRYRERLWFGKTLFLEIDGKQAIEQSWTIGDVLMWELRGPGIAKKNEDSWNFGMLWWDRILIEGKPTWFLWATAEVTYLGMASRRDGKILTMR